MRPGRKAASKMPSDGCVALFPARPISPPSQCTASAASSLFTITPHENALTSKHPPRPSPKRCTSSVNPPPCFRRDDVKYVVPSEFLSLPEHVLQHPVADHRNTVEFDRRPHHRQVKVPGGVAAGEFIGAGGEQEIARHRAQLGTVGVALVVH